VDLLPLIEEASADGEGSISEGVDSDGGHHPRVVPFQLYISAVHLPRGK
jgi:hypothetical protein